MQKKWKQSCAFLVAFLASQKKTTTILWGTKPGCRAGYCDPEFLADSRCLRPILSHPTVQNRAYSVRTHAYPINCKLPLLLHLLVVMTSQLLARV